MSFCLLFLCKCVLYYCHRVTTQLQLINISYHVFHFPIQCKFSNAVAVTGCHVGIGTVWFLVGTLQPNLHSSVDDDAIYSQIVAVFFHSKFPCTVARWHCAYRTHGAICQQPHEGATGSTLGCVSGKSKVEDRW